MTLRERVRAVTDGPRFQQAVITLILLNAVILGLETSPEIMARHGGVLHAFDMLLLTVFVIEIALRIYAHGRRFFRDPWSWFDIVIVGIALLPSSGPFAVFRVLRVLRVLRLLSVIPSLRKVVSGLLAALPGMASIALLLSLLLYVAGVMATRLFHRTSPEYFGDLWSSLFTLFQIMTGDGWGEIARPIMERQPLAWTFFVGYILVSTFVALNLFIAVAVNALEHEGDEEQPGRPSPGAPAEQAVLAELRELRAEVAALRAERHRV
ncbi:ion transporter [Allonocardiopsis opalescens]|uniref:Voltage-gated sodium channel n=1 Tax=Allonocardiopsis opalescens TaxID=1144618 RepID=A0A2T0Q097_9ACTN|nr:ion transporter [Allonocardiopsis opalescens]PRX97217.1 voltage-gated sodium channel [Allonocardiopsis opalescens]